MDEGSSKVGAAGAVEGLITRRRLLAAAGATATAVLLAACADPSPSPAAPMPSRATGGPAALQTPGDPRPSPVPSVAPGSASVAPRIPDNPVARENRLRGDPRWDGSRQPGGVEAYAGVASVAPGDRIAIHASGLGTVDVAWYRLGWYDGAGARLLAVDRGVALRPGPGPVRDGVTGLVEAGWQSVVDRPLPDAVPSGMLLAVLSDPGGSVVANVPVVLRPASSDASPAPVLFVSAAATWQAYNAWGGLDLYGNQAGVPVSATRGERAAAVSFDRPYHLDGGAGYLRRWELPFVRWMERTGRDVAYVADVDLERNPSLASGRSLIVMAGHPEYWSRPMRATIEAAIATGTSVAFLTANEVYWQMRLEDGPAGPATRVVCYKRERLDPMTAIKPALATCRWREPPVSDPEAPLVGQMYGAVVARPADWVVESPAHWLYEGTRLAAGDRIANLVGQEFDTFFPDLAQPGTTILARGKVETTSPPEHDAMLWQGQPTHTATVYVAQSGATVLAAGTFQWSWAVDHYGDRAYHGIATPYDPRVARMTANLFDRLGDGPLAP